MSEDLAWKMLDRIQRPLQRKTFELNKMSSKKTAQKGKMSGSLEN